MSNREINACSEHIEEAMDDLINEEETFPIIEKYKEEKCAYCDNNAEYKIKSNN